MLGVCGETQAGGAGGSLPSPLPPTAPRTAQGASADAVTAQGGEEPGRSLKTPQAKSRPRRHQPLFAQNQPAPLARECVLCDFCENASRFVAALVGAWLAQQEPPTSSQPFGITTSAPCLSSWLGQVLRQPTGGLVQTGPGLWPASERTHG